jgi:2-polyprenyl-3-methyl-5-hydroxy-6-metoxy-1,4-benzoquinol methylase
MRLRFPGRSRIAPRRLMARRVDAVDALRLAWSRYPEEWKSDPALSMGAETLGDEWGGPEFADRIIELVGPYLGPQVDVLELGCGGGKFSRRLAPRCRSLLCSDISSEMIDHTHATLSARGLGENVDYVVLNGLDFSGVPDESADFIFSYDVLLHLPPENVFSYMCDARRVLRDNGILMLHQVNLASQAGMEHFLKQYFAGSWRLDFHNPRRRGHMYFMSEDQMRAIADAARLVVEEIVADFPSTDSKPADAVHGRDLIGFFRLMPSRLRNIAPDSVRLVRAEGEPMVYAVLDGARVAFASSRQFIAAGFLMQRIELLTTAELAQLAEGQPLAPWE